MINRKHLGVRTAFGAARVLAANLARGQTNFARMLWKFSKVYNADLQYADHQWPVRYELPHLAPAPAIAGNSTSAPTAPRRNRCAVPGQSQAADASLN